MKTHTADFADIETEIMADDEAIIASLRAINAELFAALQAIPMSCEHTTPHLLACWVCKARAAIARATGAQA